MTDITGGRPIRPVILAGGAGTRLWPLVDRARGPSICCRCSANASLFEQTLDRFGDAVRAADHRRQPGAGGRSSRPSRGSPPRSSSNPASATARRRSRWPPLAPGEDELLLICPSDHHIGDVAAFHAAIGMARAGGGSRATSSPSGSNPIIPRPASAILPGARARAFARSTASSKSRRSKRRRRCSTRAAIIGTPASSSPRPGPGARNWSAMRPESSTAAHGGARASRA